MDVREDIYAVLDLIRQLREDDQEWPAEELALLHAEYEQAETEEEVNNVKKHLLFLITIIECRLSIVKLRANNGEDEEVDR